MKKLWQGAAKAKNILRKGIDVAQEKISEGIDITKEEISKKGGVEKIAGDGVGVVGGVVGKGVGIVNKYLDGRKKYGKDEEHTISDTYKAGEVDVKATGKKGEEIGRKSIKTVVKTSKTIVQKVTGGVEHFKTQINEFDVTEEYRTIKIGKNTYVIPGDTKSNVDAVKTYLTSVSHLIPSQTTGRKVVLDFIVENTIKDNKEFYAKWDKGDIKAVSYIKKIK